MWMSDCAIDWLRESLKNHGDATFASASEFIFQFYVISGQKNTMILSCAYCILPSKMIAT